MMENASCCQGHPQLVLLGKGKTNELLGECHPHMFVSIPCCLSCIPHHAQSELKGKKNVTLWTSQFFDSSQSEPQC